MFFFISVRRCARSGVSNFPKPLDEFLSFFTRLQLNKRLLLGAGDNVQYILLNPLAVALRKTLYLLIGKRERTHENHEKTDESGKATKSAIDSLGGNRLTPQHLGFQV